VLVPAASPSFSPTPQLVPPGYVPDGEAVSARVARHAPSANDEAQRKANGS
jgi:hypothetical protein